MAHCWRDNRDMPALWRGVDRCHDHVTLVTDPLHCCLPVQPRQVDRDGASVYKGRRRDLMDGTQLLAGLILALWFMAIGWQANNLWRAWRRWRAASAKTTKWT